MKDILKGLGLAFLFFLNIAATTYCTDIIMTKTSGIWSDTRSYATIDAAVTAIGAIEQTLYIAQVEATTALTIPVNIKLKFINDGAINNTGQLTINTYDIEAKDYQIFVGTGDIDFAAGSIVRSSWFSCLDEALDVTSDDTLTMVISEAETTTADMAVGDDVILKWESPHIITIAVADTISNINNIEAGNYQIFAGAGDIDFSNGTVLHSSWFNSLVAVTTYIGTDSVSLLISEPETVASNLTINANTSVFWEGRGNVVTIEAGCVVTNNGHVEAGIYPIYIFTNATSEVVWGTAQPVEIEWYGVSIAETSTNNAIYANYAVADMINKGKLQINGSYDIDDEVQITIAASFDTINIEGQGYQTGFNQVTNAAHIIEVTSAGAQNGWTDITFRDFKLNGGVATGDGLILRRCNGILENIKVDTVGGTAFRFLGCIELQAGHLEVNIADKGVELGTYYNAVPLRSNSTNACVLDNVRIHTTTTYAMGFISDVTNDLRPKGNTISGLETSVLSGIILYMNGGHNNTFITPWFESAGGAATKCIHMEANGVEVPRLNMFLQPRFVSDATIVIDIDEGDDNTFIGGYYSSTSEPGVDIEALATFNRFLYITNFPTEPKDTSRGVNYLSNSSATTLILSHGSGGSDGSYNYHSTGSSYANNTVLRWYDSTGVAMNVLGMDASDRVNLRGPEGGLVMRMANTTENPTFLRYINVLSTNGNSGTFTLAAAASKVVANTSITASSIVVLTPANVNAGALENTSKSLFILSKNAGVSFTVRTADNTAAAGTETYNYLVFN